MSFEKSVPLYSIQNARELGGYMTADDREIKHGLLLRTAKLYGISDEDVCTLKDTYNLQHIIDFRMPMEMVGAEDPAIIGAEYHHLDVIDMSAFAAEDAPAVDFISLDLIGVTQLTLQSGMLEENMYIGFLMSDYGKKAFSEFFHILIDADSDRAVLWHCTGGKDRTGIAAMLLLSALGVSEKDIIEDYLLTNVYNAERIEKSKLYLRSKDCDDDFIQKALLVFDAVDGRFMQNTIAFLKKEYGSVVGYIRDELNISEKEINSLKEKYFV